MLFLSLFPLTSVGKYFHITVLGQVVDKWESVKLFSVSTCGFYVDLWQSGIQMTSRDETYYVLNCMCDLTQFVISTIVTDSISSSLAKVFMEQVVLSYRMVAVIIVDVDSKFHGSFSTMCNLLNITFWPLACYNHKGLSIERYHHLSEHKPSGTMIAEHTKNSLPT